ncbi:TPA: S24 family peptidase [Yersinia enterocolitica]|uniref:S24 family peptidase n=1 Tax=Yersinia sp. LJYL362 TaxID=3402108 RepID=UPI0032F683B1|nr:S24 family peptidase [Yersinia enterocolitica]HDL7454778.1 S24 family peptidase [Yersinia enterocolitica]
MNNLIPIQRTRRTYDLNLFTPVENNRFIAVMPDDTMTGEIECRDKVIIDTTPMRYFEDGIFAFFLDGIFMIKRLQFIRINVWVLPSNKFYESLEIASNDLIELMIIGRVIYSQEIRSH